MEQYMVGCLSFDVSEYFKRYLATNATVRMFTRLLSYHATNDVAVNHYAFCYLRRLCSFRLQQDFPAPLKPVKDINGLTTTQPIPVSATSSIGEALAPVGKEHLDILKWMCAILTMHALPNPPPRGLIHSYFPIYSLSSN